MRRRLSVVEYNLNCDLHKGSQPSVIAPNFVIGPTSFETAECRLRLETLPLSLKVITQGSGVVVADGPSVRHPPGRPRCNQEPWNPDQQ